MTLTTDKQPHKSIRVKNENSSAKKKSSGKFEECPEKRTDDLGTVEQQKSSKSPQATSFPRIGYQIFDNTQGKCNILNIRSSPPESSNGVQKIVKQISKFIEEENTFTDSNLPTKNRKPRRFVSNNADVKAKAKPKISGSGKKEAIKSEEVEGRLGRQNATHNCTTRKSSAASTCSSVSRSSRVPAYQLFCNLSRSSDSTSTFSTKTTVATPLNSDRNSETSETEPNKVRLKKLKRSEIPLRKTLPNAFYKKAPVSVSLLMEKSLKEVESDVSIDICQSLTSDDHFLMTTQWSTQEKTMDEVGISESDSNVKCDDFVQDTQLTRTIKTANIPLDSQISSFELSKKTSISICKGKRLNFGAVNRPIFQRLESLHQQTVSIKEKQGPSASSSELEELCSNSSFSKLKQTSAQNQQKHVKLLEAASLKRGNKKLNQEAQENPNSPKNRDDVGSKSKMSPGKLLNKNRQVVAQKQVETPNSKNSSRNKYRFTLKEDSIKRRFNMREADIRKNGKINKVISKLRDNTRKPLGISNKVAAIDGGSDAFETVEEEETAKLTFKDGTTESERADYLLQLLIDQVPTSAGPDDYFRYKELMSFVGEIKSSSTFPLDCFETPASPPAKEPKKLPQNKFSTKGKPKKVKSDKIDLQEKMEKVYHSSSNHAPIVKRKTSTKLEVEDKFEVEKHDVQLVVNISAEEGFGKLIGTLTSSERKLETVKTTSLGRLIVTCSTVDCSEGKLEKTLSSTAEKEEKIETVLEETLQQESSDAAKKDTLADIVKKDTLTDAAKKETSADDAKKETLADAVKKNTSADGAKKDTLTDAVKKETSADGAKKDTLADSVKKDALAAAVHENPVDHSSGLKPESEDSKGFLEKKKWFLNPTGHFSSATSVKSKKQKPEVKSRRNTTKPFEKVEKDLNDLFEEIAALRLKRRNSEPNSFRGFVRKTTDTIIPKSNKTSVSSTCSSLRHLNTDELEDFRVWESVPMKMTSCWEVSLYHIRRPWSVLSCSVFKDNQRASTPGIILENLRNGSSFESRRSISSQKSKVITPKEASFDVEPSIAQKNLDIRNWLSALNFPPPPTLSNDVLPDINCCNLPVSSSSQSKIMLKKRKIPRGIKYSEETLSSKFNKYPEGNRKWGFDLPKSKELVRRKSGGYVAVSRESENHFSWTKHSPVHVKAQAKTKKEKVSRKESKVSKCESVTASKEKMSEIPEKAACSIQVKESDFEEMIQVDTARVQDPAEIVESDFPEVVKESGNAGAENFNIWKYLFFASLLVIIYNYFGHNYLGSFN